MMASHREIRPFSGLQSVNEPPQQFKRPCHTSRGFCVNILQEHRSEPRQLYFAIPTLVTGIFGPSLVWSPIWQVIDHQGPLSVHQLGKARHTRPLMIHGKLVCWCAKHLRILRDILVYMCAHMCIIKFVERDSVVDVNSNLSKHPIPRFTPVPPNGVTRNSHWMSSRRKMSPWSRRIAPNNRRKNLSSIIL